MNANFHFVTLRCSLIMHSLYSCLLMSLITRTKNRTHLKVTGDSLLIHEFAYSLFISHCSVASSMTGYSHWYHWIKLIHCGAPQRDVLSAKMVL